MKVAVRGGKVVQGVIAPHGAKNSAVALIPATVLYDVPVTLLNVPDITDVRRQISMLEQMGSRVNWQPHLGSLTIDNRELSIDGFADLASSSMRGTSIFWGPLVTRFGEVRIRSEPLGCSLGARPMTTHYEMLQGLGVNVNVDDEGVCLRHESSEPQSIWLMEASPTATESAILRALGLRGETVIYNAACEPHVQDLCAMLVASGAQIDGIGSNLLTIQGRGTLANVQHRVLSDHCEIATFLAIAAITGGSLRVLHAIPEHMGFIRNVFQFFGVQIRYEGDTAVIDGGQTIRLKTWPTPLTLKGQPWPALPVDLLPLFIPMALAAERGQVLFHNWMYERGLRWVDELAKLGANLLTADIHRVVVTAGHPLRGAEMIAPDIIRAVVAMVMAALIAEGETIIYHADYLDRGHPEFDHNLRRIGLDIQREL